MVINPIVGVYIPIIRIPIKDVMTISNIATFDHGTCDPSNLVVKIPSKWFSAFEHSMSGMGRKTPPTLYLPDQKRLTRLKRFCFWCENFESDVLFILKLAQVLPKVSEFSPKILPRHGVSTYLCFELSERGTLQHGGAGLTMGDPSYLPQKMGGQKKSDGSKLHQ